MTETKKKIKELKESLPRVREKVIAMVTMLVLSLTMIASVSYAWYTLSFAPEVTEITTTIVGNGSLEIALSGPDGLPPADSLVGDSFAATGQTVVDANLTWGNLLNLGGSYGIEQIVLRPATFDASSRFFLSSVSYDESGRVEDILTDFAFTGWREVDKQTHTFAFQVVGNTGYGVRAISTVGYGEAGKSAMLKRIEAAQKLLYDAQTTYLTMTQNQNYVTSLRNIVQIYLDAEMYDMMSASSSLSLGLGLYFPNGKPSDALSHDETTSLVGIYSELRDAVEKAGDTLVYLANVHQYVKTGDESYTPYVMGDPLNPPENYLFSATTAELKERGVQIDQTLLSTFASLWKRVNEDLATLEAFNEQTAQNETVHLRDEKMLAIVQSLIDINKVRIIPHTGGAGQTVGQILTGGGSNALDFVGSVKGGEANAVRIIVESDKADLKIFENLTGARMSMMLESLDLKITKDVYGRMSTNATKNQVNSAIEGTRDLGGDVASGLEAKDTYGMVLDLWVRTNAENSILALDGLVSTESEFVPSKILLSGEGVARDAYIYKRPSVKKSESGAYTTEDVIAYRDVIKDEDGKEYIYYYSADSRSILYLEEIVETTNADGTVTAEVQRVLDDNGNYIPLSDTHLEEGKVLVRKYDEIITVTGFNGANRVYDDVVISPEKGEISATQGSGSCFIFYPKSPEEADKTLELLKFLRVAFVSEENQLLAQAYFDTEHVFATSGKYIVPLVVEPSSYTYKDANLNNCYGITMLEKNKPTRISAVVYLNGDGLENGMAMTDSITKGSLNLQFTTTEDIKSMKDNALFYETITLSASLTNANHDFGDENKDVTINAQIEGLSANENTLVQAIFQRKINDHLGTQMEPITLTNPNNSANWSATFSFNMPGTYELRSLWVNGVEYALPQVLTVSITGFEVKSVSMYADMGSDYLALTADNYASRNISVEFDSAWIPENVVARVVSEKGVYVSAPLSYNAAKRSWDGVANFTASGTYTLQYLFLSGEDENGDPYELYYELSPELQRTMTAYLGLTVQVWLDDSWQDQTFVFEKTRDIRVKAKIFTNTGDEMMALSDVELWYGKRGTSVLSNGLHAQTPNVEGEYDMVWEDGYYVGVFRVEASGQYSFAQLRVGGNIITVATAAPKINARNVSPIGYLYHATANGGIRADGLIMQNSGGTVTVNAYIKNAETADVYANFVFSGDPNKVYTIPCARMEARDEGDMFIFELTVSELKKQGFKWDTMEGTWELQSFTAIGVYDEFGRFYGTSDTETPYKPEYTLYPYEQDAEGNVLKDQLDESRIFAIFDGLDEVIAQGSVLGTDASGNPTAEFMSAQTVSGIEIMITDKILLDMINQGLLDETDITATLKLEYVVGTSNAYGSYTFTGDANKYQLITVNLAYTRTTEDGRLVYAISNDKAAYLAGEYHGQQLSITIEGIATYDFSYNGTNGKALDSLNRVLKVYSKAPTVTIHGISPTGSNPAKITYTIANATGGKRPTFTATGNQTSSFTDYKATIYAIATADNSTQRHGSFTQPTLTLSFAGIDSSSTVSLVLPAGSSSEIVFTRTGNGTVKNTLGHVSQINSWTSYWGMLRHTLNAYYGHTNASGVTISQMTIVREGITFTVYLANPLVIINPSSVNQ